MRKKITTLLLQSGSGWQAVQSDCSEALGPVGRIHCTVEDWAKFLSLYLTNKNAILKQEYLFKLMEPMGFYAGGWGVAEHDWARFWRYRRYLHRYTEQAY